MCAHVSDSHSGCNDPDASNYQSEAIEAQHSAARCRYGGCMHSFARNYKWWADFDDGSCVPELTGCTNRHAVNFQSASMRDDGSCATAGCTRRTASNFDSHATVEDGTCIFDMGSSIPCNQSIVHKGIAQLLFAAVLRCGQPIFACASRTLCAANGLACRGCTTTANHTIYQVAGALYGALSVSFVPKAESGLYSLGVGSRIGDSTGLNHIGAHRIVQGLLDHAFRGAASRLGVVPNGGEAAAKA
eukprot:4803642-Prymnesium_polylepis.1